MKSELESAIHLSCWFCGNESYIVVIDKKRLISYLKCSKCHEPFFVNHGVKVEDIRQECKDCHFWELPIKLRKCYCSENDSYYLENETCANWTKRIGLKPSVPPSETSDKQTENEHENDRSILRSSSDSSNKT